MWRQDNRDVFAFSLSWFEHSKGVEDINYLVAYPPWFIPLNLNLRNHSELSIVILRLLNCILNFRSWVDKSPHHFESELCIIPHLKIASNKRMCQVPPRRRRPCSPRTRAGAAPPAVWDSPLCAVMSWLLPPCDTITIFIEMFIYFCQWNRPSVVLW